MKNRYLVLVGACRQMSAPAVMAVNDAEHCCMLHTSRMANLLTSRTRIRVTGTGRAEAIIPWRRGLRRMAVCESPAGIPPSRAFTAVTVAPAPSPPPAACPAAGPRWASESPGNWSKKHSEKDGWSAYDYVQSDMRNCRLDPKTAEKLVYRPSLRLSIVREWSERDPVGILHPVLGAGIRNF